VFDCQKKNSVMVIPVKYWTVWQKWKVFNIQQNSNN